ncbi:hypothetical protein UlMin_044423 [Ulmus minor]
MAIAAAVIVPVGLLFFVSGLIVNLIQAICFVLIRPISKNTYRRINRVVVEWLWLELVWLFDWWAGVKVQLYTDRETFQKMGKEHALLISNHRSDIDWLVGWVLALVLGWSMWFSEYLFLERSWAKDENTLKKGIQQKSDYPQPFWLALFVEGTRFTRAKLLAAQEYAASTGQVLYSDLFNKPVPRNVLIPRTKGFVAAVNNMRSFVPAVYDIKLAIPKTSPPPTMLRIFKGQSSVVHLHIKRHLMKDLPESEDDIAQWCKDLFVEKDKLLDKHAAEGTFPGAELQDIGRPLKSFVVVASWTCLLGYGALKFFQWWSILSSWKGIAFSTLFLGLATFYMHILILFSQSERSNPAKVVPAKCYNNGDAEQSEAARRQNKQQ